MSANTSDLSSIADRIDPSDPEESDNLRPASPRVATRLEAIVDQIDPSDPRREGETVWQRFERLSKARIEKQMDEFRRIRDEEERDEKDRDGPNHRAAAA